MNEYRQDDNSGKMKGIWLLRILVYGGLLFACISFAFEFWPISSHPFPRWNCEYQEINIKTGQSRIRKYRCFIRTKYEVKDTVLSKAISEAIDISDIRDWHTVNRFSPPTLKVSPPYRYHEALSQVQHLEFVYNELDMVSPEISKRKKEEIAQNVLSLWQIEGDDHSATGYIYSINEDNLFKLEHTRSDKLNTPDSSSGEKP
jgi:hypothetical protein